MYKKTYIIFFDFKNLHDLCFIERSPHLVFKNQVAVKFQMTIKWLKSIDFFGTSASIL